MNVTDALLPFGPVGGAQPLLPDERPTAGVNVADAGEETAFSAFLALSGTPAELDAPLVALVAMERPPAGGQPLPLGSAAMPSGGHRHPPGGQALPPGGRLLPSVGLPQVADGEVPQLPQLPQVRAAHAAAVVSASWFAEAPELDVAAEPVEPKDADLPALRQLGLLLGVEPGRGPVRSDAAPGGPSATGAEVPAGAPGGATMALASAVPGRAMLAALPMPAPGQGGFENAMGQRLIWMATQGVQDARVRVHPEHLGPIDIRIRIDGDAAQVVLTSPNPIAREALELALPRLRDSMFDAGLELLQAEVGDQDQRPGGSQHEGRRDAGLAAPGGARGDDAETAPAAEAGSRRVANLLDLFA